MGMGPRPPYRIEITPAARRALRALPRAAQERIRPAIDALAADPRPAGAKKLKGRGADRYRIRVGSYRVIYTVEDDRLIVLVLKVGDRKDVYRGP